LIFFAADLHLGHANIIKHCDRPFSSVADYHYCFQTLFHNGFFYSLTAAIRGGIVWKTIQGET
jgi:calcineurin-like phosphoesterase family protein